MKRKTNISIQDNRGIRVTPNLIVGEKFNGYVSGDILDANSVADLVKDSEDVDIREVKYNDLVSLRNSNKLVPGCKYRITDYVTTTTQENTQSAGHAFDIIVLATDTNVLNENAYAALHAGDTYFANCNLAAWKLRYTIDNIYWSLKPVEYITFTRYGSQVKADYIGIEVINNTEYYKWHSYSFGDYYTLTKTVGDYTYTNDYGSLTQGPTIDSYFYSGEEGKGTILRMIDEFDNDCPYDFKNIQFKRWKVTDRKGYYNINNMYMGGYINSLPPYLTVPDASDFIWTYTFSSSNSGGEQTDYSLLKSNNVYNNVIKIQTDKTLPNNVFFGNNCYYNMFSPNCTYNTFNRSCYCNTFGFNCCSNVFNYDCSLNAFGNNCSSNTFSPNCSSNTFSPNCTYNTFGNSCYLNAFGNNCYYNTFGNTCYLNTFGNTCYLNAFGNNCYLNAFGNNCYLNAFGNNCHYILFSKEFSNYNIIENGNLKINLTSTQTTSSSSPLRNIKICQGVNNTSTVKTISHNTVNDTFLTEYKPVGSQIINV